MGGLGSGRPPDEYRRREVARLRAQGLLAAEIGRRLGVSRQRIGQLFRAIDRARAGSLTCRVCGRAASPPGAAPPDAASVLCLRCLAQCPDVPFAERLRSSRAAAGLRRTELARGTGLTVTTLRGYEDGSRQPHWRHLMPLVRELGLAIVAPGAGEGSRPGWAPPPRPEPRRA
jgi:transcriptional regulator with XRE-family HTH domain